MPDLKTLLGPDRIAPPRTGPDGKTLPVYRNEWKYLISYPEAEILHQRLSPFLYPDPHAQGGGYMIRSLYFDDYFNTAYHEKMMGTHRRYKWRIRVYNCDDSHISLERKLKEGSYIFKETASLSRTELDRILSGDCAFLLERRDNLCREFYYDYTVRLLRPKVMVDYDRIPLILDEGTVRITFDRCVRAAVGGFDLFDPNLPTVSAMDADHLILEVKYTEFLPRLIQKLLPTNGQEFSAVSKYTLCYEAAHHLTDPTAGVSKTIFTGRKN